MILLLLYITLALANEDTITATFKLSTVYDKESRWKPKIGEEYLYTMKITCLKYLDPMPLRSTWESTTSPNIIHIHNCTLPTTPLAEVFKKLDLDTTRLDKLKLTDSRLAYPLPNDYSSGLLITKIELSNVLNMTINFFTSLKKHYTMSMENMEMPIMKADVSYSKNSGHLVALSLRNTTIKNMTNCEFIEDLIVFETEEDQITEWPEGCGGMLRKMRLESLSQATVKRIETIRPYLYIENLTINNCSLVELPLKLMQGFAGGSRVFAVNLPNNSLEDQAFLQFPRLRDLGFLDISYNRLTGECLRTILPNIGGGQRVFESMILDGNNFTDIFDDFEIKSALVNQSSLSRLSLNWMHLEPDCLKHTHFKWLEYLSLTSNSSKLIENLQLHDLPSTGANELTVDLRGRPVRSIRIGPNFTGSFEQLNQSDHWLTNKGYKLIILLDYIDCDCNNAVLQQALKEFPGHLYMPALRCNSKNGGLFLEEPMENLNCRKATVNGCKRILSRGQNYTTVAHCSNIGDKFLWPKPHRLRGVNVSGNDISTLRDAYLPESLEWLDLRSNKIANLTANETSRMFPTSKSRVWLAGNPIVCRCDNRPMLEVLQSHHRQIMDYQHLQCDYYNKSLVKDIFLFEVCKTGILLDNYRGYGVFKDPSEKEIFCTTTLEAEQPFVKKITFDQLSLYNCILPKTFIANILQALNIDVNKLHTLKLINVVFPENVARHYSVGLGVVNLELDSIKNGIPINFFLHLGTLRRLLVENMQLPGLASGNGSPLLDLTLKNSTVRYWTNCHLLQTLKIIGMSGDQLQTNGWPDECSGALRYLLLKDMMPKMVTKFMNFINGTSLSELSVQNCSLKETPLNLMKHLNRLNVLDLSHNELEDHAFSQFPDVKSLKTLNLAHNKLKGEFLIEVIPKVPELRELILDNNHFVHIFRNLEIKSAITSLRSLERLSLNNMTLDADCLMNSNFSNLKSLELQSTEEHKIILRLYGLPRTNAEQLRVDFSGRSFGTVQVDYDFFDDFEKKTTTDFWITNKGYTLIVKMDYVDCVCNNDVLSTTLRDFSRFLTIPGLRCDSKHGPLFTNEPLEKLNCLKATVYGCTRRISRNFKYVTTVDCSYNKERFRWPRPDHIYVNLNASGNNITSLSHAYLPETLKWLDLSNNSISRLDGNQSALLFNTSDRRIWLSGNPIACQCDNNVLLNALKTNHSQIVDYDQLMCADSTQPIRLVSVEELCRFKLEYVWGSCIALAVLVLITALFLRHYWLPLRMYLFARGYCLSCLNEDDVDEDRPYDAFLSFAHGDNEYVMEQLLPQLEGEPNFYRICVHYRDWAVGEWIPAQIIQSVRLSKRTIIVLSKNFVRSLWGAMEFRYALASIESEGRSRLLVLVLDDVLSENLTPELRSYLNLNTYLTCDDPWFWGKLRFAMPRNKTRGEGRHEERLNTPSVPSSEILPVEIVELRNNPNQSAPVNRTDDVEINTYS